MIDLNDKTELELAAIAEGHPSDKVANEAMRILREKYDKTYFWCWDCDGLVCKLKDCCMYRSVNPDVDLKF